jgi:neutral ceramidase
MALEMGIGRACITPPLDIPNGMWVAQRHVRGEGLDMDLLATVLVLADGETRVALVDLDLCFLQDALATAIRKTTGQAARVPPENVLPFCTHSHAGPLTLAGFRGDGEERVHSYMQSLPDLIAGAAAQAARSIQPVRVAVGLGRSDIGVNRDLRLPDGRFIVGCNPNGFCDPEVGVMRIDTVGGKPLACIVNYGCHPTVLGPGNKLISPDYPGSTRKIVEQITGATCFFLQGAGGNVGPVETFVADATVARRLGTRLGLEAARVHMGLDTRPVQTRLRNVIESGATLAEYEEVPTDTPAPRLAIANAFAELPMRSPLAEIYEKAPEQLVEWKAKLIDLINQSAEPSAVAAALQRVTRLQLRADRVLRYRGKKTLPVETHAVRLGDAAIAAISGEPYSEIGAEVKRRSPFPQKTLFAGYVDGDMMYIPTAEVFGYQPPPMEVDNSPYAPQAAQVAIDQLVQLLVDCSMEDGSAAR